MEAQIRIKYQNVKTAEAISNAISPDNLKVPPGFVIHTTSSERTVITNIAGNMKLSSLISTIDDLLFCISTAERILNVVCKIDKSGAHTESES